MIKRPVFDLNARDVILNLGHVTQIMGIVNCTPDSFSGDGQKNTASSLKHALKLLRDGADILDIGGESTRPGASSVSPEEEIQRVIPVIKAVVAKTKVPISVDTSKLEVARLALEAGASIINNVRATQMSLKFLKMVQEYGAAIVLMHMRGTPANMQSRAVYKNVTQEIIKELETSVEKCLSVGIKKDRIIIDPGIGFAKKFDHNLILLQQLDRLHILKCPVLLGTSRKSFIGQILDKGVNDRLMGTAATVTAGVMKGAHIVRVHDVTAIKETLKVTDAILNAHS